MGKIKCYTENLTEAKRCITQLHNAAVSPDFVIVSKTDNTQLLSDANRISSWAIEAVSAGKHLFGINQINSYTVEGASYPSANKVGAAFRVDFMAEGKAVNDLRVTCAVIAGSLLTQLRPNASFADKIFAAQRFFTRQFKYRDSGQSEAHCAVDLMRSGGGVCQAIASMATVILPFMGIPCLYVSGEGFNGSRWGPHGWNAVKNPEGEWIFVDFTFGLCSGFFPPSTITKPAEKRFLKNHRYDKAQHSAESLEESLSCARKIKATRFSLRPDTRTFSMDAITVSTGKQVLRKTKQGYSIDLVFLFRLAGGGVEYIPDRDKLHFVLYDRQCYLEKASTQMNDDGTFDIRILNVLPVLYTLEENGITLQLGGENESNHCGTI